MLQVAHVKEAIKPVCREFVPRIMTYLSRAQVINKAATRMLVTIARSREETYCNSSSNNSSVTGSYSLVGVIDIYVNVYVPLFDER